MNRVVLAAAICLVFTGVATAQAPTDPAPIGPEGDTTVANAPGEGVARCWALLRDMTAKTHARVDRSLISSNQTLGVIFRADFTSQSNPPTMGRFVCLTSGPGTVLISFQLDIPPLASGPWGAVIAYK